MLYIKEIMGLLGVNQEIAEAIIIEMSIQGADFSEMTKRKFNQMARRIAKEMLLETTLN
jgi:hypothetical protein